jgi:CDP-diacylglycerol---glycerol-3-phosphate 3-phosphatidyltransferase
LIGSKIGHSLDPAILKAYRFFLRDKDISPNWLTVCGAAFGFVAFLCVSFDFLLLGAASLLLSALFDLLDGALARNTAKETPFGGFLDSVLDRYTDLFLMFGIFIHFLRHGDLPGTAMTFLAAIGTAVIPYARARAEAASLPCKTGLLERPERLVLLLVGLIFHILPYVMVILAVLTHITVIQRIIYVRKNS